MNMNETPVTNIEKKSIGNLVSLFKSKRLILGPKFQRGSVWKLSDRTKLIDTIIRGYPIPAIFLFKRKNAKGRIVYDVIDGKQRLETLLLFMGLMPRIEGNRYSVKLTETIDGTDVKKSVSWQSLSQKVQQSILRCEIPVIYVSGTNDVISDIFVRINTRGKRLTRAEIFDTLYANRPFWKSIDKLAVELEPLFLEKRIFNKERTNRKEHVSLLSEIALAVFKDASVQDKKRAVELMMEENPIPPVSIGRVMRETEEAVRFVCEFLLPDKGSSRFSKVSDFYSLVVLIAEFMRRNSGAVLNEDTASRARGILRLFGILVDKLRQQQRDISVKRTMGEDVRDYLLSVQSNSDGLQQRRVRRRILEGLLHSVFEIKDSRRLFTKEQRRILFNSEKKKVCYLCGKPLSFDEATIDHLVAYAKGGKTSLANGRICHGSCNSRKGAR
ncbi:MAG: DUF262 domain-containing protein [Kiritimatiellae bacterium]|nr:DUF262 domain-containing protein [Kiritimatiellia bacterium]